MEPRKSQFIMGISCFYHDASASLIKDGKLIAAAEEERFTRKKHDISFPINAINYCLGEANIIARELDYIGFYEKPLLKFERLLSQYIETFPKSFWAFYKSIPSWINEKLRVPTIIRKKLKCNCNILFIEHHMAHAASAYLVSPFKESAILTIDGVGEWATTTFGYAKGNDITIKKEIHFPHSLGLLYSTVTAFLGFKVNNDEYKVMGLAPYGNSTYYDKLKKIVRIFDDGSYELDMDYFTYHYKLTMPSKKFIEEFGLPRVKESKIEQRHMDIAASLQKLTEDIIINMLNYLYKETKQDNLCIAGGVALNSVANGKILRNTHFKNVYIQPASSDAGTSLGVAFYIYNTLLGKERAYVMDNAYYGPRFTNEYIQNFLDKGNVRYKKFQNEKELIKEAADLIYKDNVVGWFQGRMEFGPRALGSRSILSNACNADMKNILNLKVKHREHFRPFAPVVPFEDTYDYFDADKPLPLPSDFMLMVYPIKENKKSLIPAVTHIDGSGRLQTIRKWQNKRYYNLIREFQKLSKVPILINTSFNIRGEPIVCTPEDAYRCMMGTGIDYLIIEDFLIARNDNPKDMWDSEKVAKD